MTDHHLTAADLTAALHMLAAVAEAIRDSTTFGQPGVPSGHLYAQLCDTLTLAQYDALIRTLVRSGVIVERDHYLTYVGPAR